MDYKRLTLLCGHYGSGKTNVAVNMAFDLKTRYNQIAVADLDIVNPYFRTKDSAADFEKAGIRLICSEYANSNVDIPALPQDMYVVSDDKNYHVVLDIGGDDRGALALGRLNPAILSENDYDMLLVINCYRPLTQDAPSTIEVMREIEAACRIPFTGIVNNSNLGEATTPGDVLASLPYAEEIAALTGLPIVATTVKDTLYEDLKTIVPCAFPLTLQQNLLKNTSNSILK